MSTPKFCIPTCLFLMPKEEAKKAPMERDAHYCSRFKQPVFHVTFFPNLVRVPKCDVTVETAVLGGHGGIQDQSI